MALFKKQRSGILFNSCAILKPMNHNLVLRFRHKLHLVQEIFLRNEDRQVEFSVIMLESHDDYPSLPKNTPRMSTYQNQEHLVNWDEIFKTL